MLSQQDEEAGDGIVRRKDKSRVDIVILILLGGDSKVGCGTRESRDD